MAAVLARVKDPIVRDKLVRGAAGRLGVSDAALLAAARRAHSEQKARAGGRPSAPSASDARAAARRGGIHFSSDAEIVELIVCDHGVASRMESEGAVDRIEDPVLRAIAERVLERRATDEYFEPLELLPDLPAAMAERVRLRLDEGAVGEVAARVVDEWFARHAERAARGDRKALIARLRAAEHRGDEAEVAAVLRALQRARSAYDSDAGATADEAAEADVAASYPPGLIELDPDDDFDADEDGFPDRS
jgi:hypothetical protein